MHGDKKQSEREAALNKFIRDECPLMFATDVAARGLGHQGRDARRQLRHGEGRGELRAQDRTHGTSGGARRERHVLESRRALSIRWFPYDPVGVVNAVPQLRTFFSRRRRFSTVCTPSPRFQSRHAAMDAFQPYP